jgi:carbonic anhydrase
MTIKTPADLLEENVRWSEERTDADPDYFAHLSGLQTPEFLWIGCSDSRVPANVITGLEPGEVFVHRNVANIVRTADINCMSVVQYAVEALKVKHIIVCGHYGCGGVKAAMEDAADGLVEHWLEPVRNLKRSHSDELNQLSDHESRLDRLCELNVKAQVDAVSHSPILLRAWERGQPVTVHGWVYGLNNGRLRDLDCTRSGPEGNSDVQ